jgi:hypothetical protein
MNTTNPSEIVPVYCDRYIKILEVILMGTSQCLKLQERLWEKMKVSEKEKN